MSRKAVLRANGECTPLDDTLASVETSATTDGRRRRGEFSSDVDAEYKGRTYQEAYSSGYEAGFAAGSADARTFEATRLTQFGDELRAVITRIEAAMELWYLRAEEGLADLGQEVARKIVAEEIELRPAVVLSIVRDALSQADRSPSAMVRLNALDLPLIEEHRESIVSVARAIPQVTFVGDDSLERGSVIIETDAGVVDATVSTKAEKLLAEEAA